MDRDVIDLLRAAAPAPGDWPHLDAVERRGRQIRRRRRTLAALAAGLVVALPLGALSMREAPDRRDDVVATVSPQASPYVHPGQGDRAFVPKTIHRDGRVVMPVTMPDGSVIEVSYPEKLAPATPFEASFRVGYELSGCCLGEIEVTPRDPGYEGFGDLVRTFPGADGRPVELRRRDALPEFAHNLVFDFGTWYAAAQVAEDTAAQADRLATLARSLRGEVGQNGFLVLRAASPLRLSPPVEGLKQTQPWLELRAGVRSIAITRTPSCGPKTPDISSSDPFQHLKMCRDGFFVNAGTYRDDRPFLQELVRSLHIKRVHG